MKDLKLPDPILLAGIEKTSRLLSKAGCNLALIL
jgi:hypothetical protein